jgi:ribosomal protein S18 acetylase RimI-like enzyme
MPTLAGDLVARVADDGDRPELGSFCCGPRTVYAKAEKEVDELVAAWCVRDPLRKNMVLRVTCEEPPGSIVGVAGLERGDIAFQNPRFSTPYRDAAYVAVIGVSERYRDDNDPYRTKAGDRMGDVLLHDMLLHIKKNWRGGMPWVFTAVDPDNESSVLLFERHGFDYMFRLAAKGDAMFRRRKNLRVS